MVDRTSQIFVEPRYRRDRRASTLLLRKVAAQAAAVEQLIGPGWYNNNTSVAGAQINVKKMVALPFGGSELSFLFTNVYGNSEGKFDLNFSVSGSVQYGSETPQPITFGGVKVLTFVAGTLQKVWSDPLLGLGFYPGQTAIVRLCVTPTASTDKIPMGMELVANATTPANGDQWNYSTTAAGDQTLNTAYAWPAATGQNYLYGWAAMKGKIPALQPSVGAMGDSIIYSVGDTSNYGTGYLNQGWLRRALLGVLPFSCQGIGGELALATNTQSQAMVRRTAVAKTTKLINELVINDIIAGATLAVVQQRVILNALLAKASAPGAQVWQVTATPYTPTSTDSWATVAGQTVAAVEPVRLAFNAWIRDGAPMTVVGTTYTAVATGTVATATNGVYRMGASQHPMFSYLDIESVVVDTSTGAYVWKAGISADGTHPNPSGHALIAASVNATKYPLLFSL